MTEEKGTSAAPLPPKRILLVEDNPINQKIARAMLIKRGLVVDIASSGSQALVMLAAARYDMVFMDCQMPGMDGYEATVRIRQQEESGGGRVPIVALTANAMTTDRERCLAAGMDDYLTKPVEPALLTAILSRWLG